MQTFLSQKYGYRPFPHRIPTTEFDSLSAAIDDEEDKQLLQVWFKLDDNAVPPEYVLQPVSTQFKDYVDPPSSEAKQQAIKDWWNVFLQLQNALRKAAVKVLAKDAAHKYLKSGTVHIPSTSHVPKSQSCLNIPAPTYSSTQNAVTTVICLIVLRPRCSRFKSLLCISNTCYC